MKNPGPEWTRISKTESKLDIAYRHTSGWVVRHCGHPTAHWPYFASHPDRSELLLAGGLEQGRGFQNLEKAMAGVEYFAALGEAIFVGPGGTLEGVRELIAAELAKRERA